MRRKVLWIDDGALGELSELLGPIVVDGSYDLAIATNASDGIARIMQTEFAAVIVDIRLPPGNDKNWTSVYYDTGENKSAGRLGLLILRSLLKPENSKIKLNIPSWVRPDVFGVFTVENRREVETELDELSVKVFRQKNINPSNTTLLDLVKEVITAHERELG